MSGWPTCELRSLILKLDSGFAFSTSRLVSDGLPHLRPFNIGSNGKIDLEKVYSIPTSEAPPSKLLLHPGDLLFNNTNSEELVGKIAHIESEISAGWSNHITRLRVDASRLESAFLAFYIRYLWSRSYFKRNCTRWVGQAAFNSSAIKALTVPLPPLPEQRRIVDILDHAHSILRLRREAQEKVRQMIPALFVQMFGDPVENPMGWETDIIGNLVAGFEGGKNLQAGSGGDTTTPYRILKVSAVTSGFLKVEESKPAPDGYRPPRVHFVKLGDLLFSRANTSALVGATALVQQPTHNILLPDKIWRFAWKNDSRLMPVFTWRLFQTATIRQKIGNLATGTSASMKNISQKRLKSLEIPVPPLSKQEEFAQKVADIEALLTQQTRQAQAAEATLQSLMARFFATAP